MTSTAVTTTTMRPNEPAITARATVPAETPDGAARAVAPGGPGPVRRASPPALDSAGRTAVTARTGSTMPCPVPGPAAPRAVASIRATTWAALSPG